MAGGNKKLAGLAPALAIRTYRVVALAECNVTNGRCNVGPQKPAPSKKNIGPKPSRLREAQRERERAPAAGS